MRDMMLKITVAIVTKEKEEEKGNSSGWDNSGWNDSNNWGGIG